MSVYDSACGGYRIFIRGIKEETQRNEMIEEVKKHDNVLNFWFARKPPGSGYVVFRNAKDAEAMVRDIDERKFTGARLLVEHAKPYRTKTSSRVLPFHVIASRLKEDYVNVEKPMSREQKWKQIEKEQKRRIHEEGNGYRRNTHYKHQRKDQLQTERNGTNFNPRQMYFHQSQIKFHNFKQTPNRGLRQLQQISQNIGHACMTCCCQSHNTTLGGQNHYQSVFQGHKMTAFGHLRNEERETGITRRQPSTEKRNWSWYRRPDSKRRINERSLTNRRFRSRDTHSKISHGEAHRKRTPCRSESSPERSSSLKSKVVPKRYQQSECRSPRHTGRSRSRSRSSSSSSDTSNSNSDSSSSSASSRHSE